MANKPVWEQRFGMLRDEICYQKEWVLAQLGRIAAAADAADDKLNTRGYWQLKGKLEAFEILEQYSRQIKTTYF